MEKYIAAIDQGTTSTRCLIFDHTGKIVGLSQKEHRQIYPQPGWVEHDPMEILQNTRQVISEALMKASINPDQIEAIGITNQRETTIIWDKNTGLPYANAVVWQDTRTTEFCNQLSGEDNQDRFRLQTGLPIATYFSGPKIKWLMDHDPNIFTACHSGNALFGTIDTWLIWNLTGGINGGVHITDVTNASRTLLFNIYRLEWDQDILSILNIPANVLPKVAPSSGPLGICIDPILKNVPICSDLGDQHAALFGQTCFDIGEAKNTYGTGCFMLLNTGTLPIQSKHGLLTTIGYQIGNFPVVYSLEGSIAITGALVQWLRDNLGFISSSAEIENLAVSVPDNGGVYFVPAFSGLYAPYWRSDARGVIVGLTRFANKAHIARAALEATAFQTREVLDAMQNDTGVHLKALKVDGGMVINSLLMQFQSDILNVTVSKPKINETTSLGAAFAAGLATGYWSSQSDLRTFWQMDKEWHPSMDEQQREMLYTKWKKAVSKSFDWLT